MVLILSLYVGSILRSRHTKSCCCTYKKCRCQVSRGRTGKWCRATCSTTQNTEMCLSLYCATTTRCFSRWPRYETWSNAHTCTSVWWSAIARIISIWLLKKPGRGPRRKERERRMVSERSIALETWFIIQHYIMYLLNYNYYFVRNWCYVSFSVIMSYCEPGLMLLTLCKLQCHIVNQAWCYWHYVSYSIIIIVNQAWCYWCYVSSSVIFMNTRLPRFLVTLSLTTLSV